MLHSRDMGMKRLAVKGFERCTRLCIEQGRLGLEASPVKTVP